MAGVFFLGERNVLPVSPDTAHRAAHFQVSRAPAINKAGQGLDDNLIAFAFLQQKPGYATRRVAAGLHFPSVDIEDSHECCGFGLSWRLENDQLVTANSSPDIADPYDLLFHRRPGIVSRIDDDKMIEQAMHFDEESAG